MSGAPGTAPARAATPRAGRLLYAVLFGTHAGPWLLPRAPLTVARVARALAAPARGGVHAFGERDAGFRGWYRKVAEDQRACGRAGYVWDDGLGLPMNPRFYNNAGTYLLYGALGVRAYAALSMLLFLGMVAAAYALAGAPAMGAAAALVLLASPLFLGAQLHLGKPEILWWAALVPLALAAWKGWWLAAGLVFAVIAAANFAVAFLAGVTCLLLLALFWPGAHGAGMLLLGMAPGLLKTALRLLPFVRSGWLGALVGEQSSAAGPGVGAAARLRAYARSGTFVLYAVPYLGALALVVGSGRLGAAHAALGVAALAIFLLGQSVFYLNDPQSFWMWHLALLSAMAAASPSWGGVAGLALLAYVHPRVLGLPLSPAAEPAGAGVRARAAAAARQLAAFPALAPVTRDEWAAPVRTLLRALSPGTRLLMEPACEDRELGGYRAFMLLCDGELPPAGVELVPDEYVRAYHPRLYTEVLARFRAGAAPGELRETAAALGAGWVLAYTPALVCGLEAAGFSRVQVLDPGTLSARARALLHLPPAPLVLLRAPGANGVVSPAAPLERRGNALRWPARSGESYLVRYAWHPRMRAEQGGRALEVHPEPQAGGRVTFMRVRAEAHGPLTLRFHPRWLA